ncbi:MAG: S9 family peptidase [Planctomycetes bacterium]|nr:S9 family peptidase [Planctomycetota bacterium]MCC7169028.1 S9 family peptidase [Planctomycetota bacterium]
MLASSLALALLVQDPAPAPAADPAPPPVAPSVLRPTLEEIFLPQRVLGQRPRVAGVSADGQFALYSWTDQDAEEVKRDLYLVKLADGTSRKLFAAKDEVDARWSRVGAVLIVKRGTWLELHDVGGNAPVRPLFELGHGGIGHQAFRKSNRIALSGGDDQQIWIIDLDSGARSTPAAALKNRSGWFQLLRSEERIAVFADRSAAPESSNTDAPAAETKAAAPNPPTRGRSERNDTGSTDEGKSETPPRVLWLVPLDGSAPIETKFEQPSDGRVDVSADGLLAVTTASKNVVERRAIMADYLGEFVEAVPVRNDKAGDPGNAIALRAFDLTKGVAIDAPLDEGTNYFLHSTEFATTGHELLVHRVSNDFKVRQVLLVDALTHSTRLLFSERDDAWIGGPLEFAEFTQSGDGVVFTSEQSGFNRLYACALDGSNRRLLTPGDSPFEIDGAFLPEGQNVAIVRSNETDFAERCLWKVDLASGQRTRLSEPGGVSDFPQMNLNGSVLVYGQEFLGQPQEIYTVSTSGEPAPRRLTTTVPKEFAELKLPAPEIITFKNKADDVAVRAYLYRPEPFDPARKYPVVMFVHGAGYLQQVLKSMSSYAPNMLFHHRLARKGFVVVDVDYRHSEGYGRKFRTDIHGFMGGKDLDDCVAAIEHLGTLGFADTTRVGLYGGSYGGFMTLMALFTKPDVFHCGAALRSVTDWRAYNSWYTTPRLGDPKKDEENYKKSSPIEHIDGLKGHLLLMHGLKDSNVFAQDSIRLVEKLIQAKKDFDVAIYPSQDHGFTDPESWLDEYKRIEALFERELRSTQ